jgi:glucosylceramidase
MSRSKPECVKQQLDLSFVSPIVNHAIAIMNALLCCFAAIPTRCLTWLSLSFLLAATSTQADVEVWLTDPDHSVLFEKQSQLLPLNSGAASGTNIIHLDGSRSYQSIDGFGYTLTGGSAMHMIRMSPPARAALLRELFATDGTNIGVSYLRVSIGASDLSATTFTYDDMPTGETDVNLAHFSIEREKQELIPILKKIVALNPAIKILGSPWSAPLWMKNKNSFVGGNLKPEYYAAYANYFVKYIQVG